MQLLTSPCPTYYGVRCSVACEAGYRLTSGAASADVTCEQYPVNGGGQRYSWTTPPTCQISSSVVNGGDSGQNSGNNRDSGQNSGNNRDSGQNSGGNNRDSGQNSGGNNRDSGQNSGNNRDSGQNSGGGNNGGSGQNSDSDNKSTSGSKNSSDKNVPVVVGVVVSVTLFAVVVVGGFLYYKRRQSTPSFNQTGALEMGGSRLTASVSGGHDNPQYNSQS